VAATVTRTIELGTGVLQVPPRRPVELGHRALTTHLVSGGRLRLGVGSGSTAADFAAVGVDFTSRFRQLDESLTLMRTLWTGARVGEAQLGTPWPVDAGCPPILIGSWGGIPMDRVSGAGVRRLGGVGRPVVVTPDPRGHRPLPRSRGLARRLHQRGRAPRSATSSPTGPDDPCDLVGPPPVAAERLRQLRQLGFDDVVLVAQRYDTAHLAELRQLL